MSRRLVVLEDLPAGGHFSAQRDVEPTPGDVGRWLDDHPEHHQAVLGAVRVIRCWSATHGVVMLDHPLTGRTLASACHDLDGDDCWTWQAGPPEDRAEGRCGTKGEAMDGMAAAMRLRGWVVP